MTERRGFHDVQRCVLRVDGEEARDWLQSLITNDISRLSPERAIYAALLSPQGKYLFDFICHDVAGGGVLLDVAADRAEDLLKRLGLYRIRRKVRVTHQEALGVALIWGGEAAPEGAVPDPRSAALGWRLIAEDPLAALAERHVTPAEREEYDALRVAAGVPETGVELLPDDTYILEAGFERLNGVDFRKGCYVGQEVTARMHHKTELRKGLVRVRVEGTAPPPGTEIKAADGRTAGMLFSVCGGLGLAHLRYDRAEGPMRAGEALVQRAG